MKNKKKRPGPRRRTKIKIRENETTKVGVPRGRTCVVDGSGVVCVLFMWVCMCVVSHARREDLGTGPVHPTRCRIASVGAV